MGKNVTDVGFEVKPEQHEIKKHAAAIHCSNTLSLLQRKISNALLYHAYKELMLKEEHEISVKQLCKLISYHGHNHSAIKEALKGLISTVIEWNVVDDSTGTEDWTASSIIASVSMQGPLCYYAYSPRMKQLLHSPSMFGKINLVIQSRFTSSYGLALYENCIRYRGLPYTKWFDMDTFRKLMGVPDGKYMIFRDFKKRVLDKSVEEINRFSDLMVEVELAREGRLVTRVRFSLKEREKKMRLGGVKNIEETKALAGEALDNDGEMLKMRLMNHYGLSLEKIQAMLNDYSAHFIIEKMALIESSKNYQEGKVHNLAAYLLSALKNNFQSPQLMGKSILGLSKKTDPINKARLRRIAQKIHEDYRVDRESRIDQAIQALSIPEKENFLSQFVCHAADPITIVLRLQKSKYNRETVIHSPQIQALMRHFFLEKMPALKMALPSIDQYIESLPEAKQALWEEFKVISPDSDLLRMTEFEVA